MSLQKLKLLYIAQGFGRSLGISGGDMRFIETAKRIVKRGFSITILTTRSGRILCRKYGLKNVNYLVTGATLISEDERIERSKYERALSYIAIMIKVIPIISKLRALKNYKRREIFDIVYATSDFFVDVLPALIMKFLGISKRAIVFIHHEYPLSLRRKPYLISFIIALVQRLIHYLVAKCFDAVFVCSTCEGGKIAYKLKKINKNLMIIYMKNGIDLKLIEQIRSISREIPRKYHLCYVAALRESKGVFDFIKIVDLLVNRYHRHIKCCLIGSGAPELIRRIEKEIRIRNLHKTIDLKGFIPSRFNFYRVLSECKILVHPSYEEGWCITILEALALGLQVVAYDLPAYRPIYRGLITVVPVGSIREMADAILQMIKDDTKKVRNLIGASYKLLERYDWERISLEEAIILKRLILNKDRFLR